VTPSVSIVIPNFNKGRLIEATVRSALEQADSEVIVVDDASTDDSLAIVRSLSHGCARLRIVALTENRGGSHCRNQGLHASIGEFVIFLDSDDLLLSGAVRERLRVAGANDSYDLWVFPMLVFRGTVDDVVDRWIPRPGPHLRNFLSHRLDWSIMQPMWRRSFLGRIGGFDESFTRLQDPELHARALQAGARVFCASSGAADCLYRVAVDRHDGEGRPIAARHVAGALHFYEAFWPRTAGVERRALTGTLLASIASVDHWRRAGHVSAGEAEALERRLIGACRISWHRRALAELCRLNRASPRRIRGLNSLARSILTR
jgi:glycosyltransferase involved in cell wall biosynthesis